MTLVNVVVLSDSRTVTGLAASLVVLFPRFPEVLSPQHFTSAEDPEPEIAQACVLATETCETLVRDETAFGRLSTTTGTDDEPVFPSKRYPQHDTVAFERTAHVV